MFSGNPKVNRLEIDVTVQDRAGSQISYKASSDRNFNYTNWHNIAVRFQDTESLIRIFLDNKRVYLHPFGGFDSFPAGAQLRLAQIFEIGPEDTFEVSCFYLSRNLFPCVATKLREAGLLLSIHSFFVRISRLKFAKF